MVCVADLPPFCSPLENAWLNFVSAKRVIVQRSWQDNTRDHNGYHSWLWRAFWASAALFRGPKRSSGWPRGCVLEGDRVSWLWFDYRVGFDYFLILVKSCSEPSSLLVRSLLLTVFRMFDLVMHVLTKRKAPIEPLQRSPLAFAIVTKARAIYFRIGEAVFIYH